MLRGELPGRSFVRGQLFGGGAIFLGSNYPRRQLSGDRSSRGQFPGGQLSGHLYINDLYIYIFIYLFIYLFIYSLFKVDKLTIKTDKYCILIKIAMF